MNISDIREARFRKIVEEVEDYAILLLDREGNIENWNKGAELMKGYSAQEIIGKNFKVFYTEADQRDKLPERLIEKAFKDGKVKHEGWRVKKNGFNFWGSILITAIHDENGEVIGFTKVTRDLSDKKYSEENLRRTEDNYSRMIAEVEEYAILLIDIDGKILTWNKGAQKIKGYSADEVIGKNFRLFFPSQDLKSGKPEYLLELAKREGRAKDEGWRITKDGTSFWGSIVITARYDQVGNIIGFSKITRDLTERKKAEEQLIYEAKNNEKKKNELLLAYEEIRTTNEALKNANEEIHAANEELSAANEEIYASNEELKALNEELEAANEIVRMQSEELLRKNEEKTNLILSSINDVVWAVDYETNRVTYISDGIKALYGVTPDEAMNDPSFMTRLIFPEDFSHILKVREENKSNDTFKVEFRIIHAITGETRWIESQSWKHYDTNNKPEFRLGVARDITVAKKSIELLAESEEKYKNLFENSPLPMLIFENDAYTILDVNQTICTRYGYSKEEFLQLNLRDIRPPSKKKKFDEQTATSKAINASSNISYGTHQTKDGKIIEVLAYTNQIFYQGKKVWITLISDITEQKKLEFEREQLVKKLTLRNKELEDYSYVTSHHIRKPLVGILGLIGLIGTEGLDEVIVKDLLLCARELDEVVYDMNEILANNSEAFEEMENIDIREEIFKITSAFDGQVKFTGAVINFEEDEVKTIYTNRLCFDKVISGLMSNAIKYRSPKHAPVIKIKSFYRDDYTCISVSDNGLGFDIVKNKDKLFGLFKRFHFHVEGKGLSLYLLKNQLERLGGKIEVESEVDNGATFTAYFKNIYEA